MVSFQEQFAEETGEGGHDGGALMDDTPESGEQRAPLSEPIHWAALLVATVLLSWIAAFVLFWFTAKLVAPQ